MIGGAAAAVFSYHTAPACCIPISKPGLVQPLDRYSGSSCVSDRTPDISGLTRDLTIPAPVPTPQAEAEEGEEGGRSAAQDGGEERAEDEESQDMVDAGDAAALQRRLQKKGVVLSLKEDPKRKGKPAAGGAGGSGAKGGRATKAAPAKGKK